MILSKEKLTKIPASTDVVVPQNELFSLPEKVLQFGTGVLLRGLPNYYIDKANRSGVFNGRIVVVKSTDKGGTEAFVEQDALYTLCVRGIQDGKQVDQKIINSSVSRVLSASSEWEQIMACASSKDMKVVISNTTETGIRLVKEDRITANPPISFPGKLLAFLYERYKVFNGSYEQGVVILPTELISENGKTLKNVCLQLAAINELDEDFMYWLVNANEFCNTLVDRIVPGALPSEEHKQVEASMGYQDNLMIMAEPYSLWAIETISDRTKEILSFAKIDSSVVLAEDINKYKEIKLRLLNAPHTLSCGLAIWFGFKTVKQAMDDESFRSFIAELMHNEITPALVGKEISVSEATVFADKVLDRFSNPFIAHEWINISAQYTSKIMMRCIPMLLSHYSRSERVPRSMTLGFAAYMLFMNSKKESNGVYVGNAAGKSYNINDEKAPELFTHWQAGNDSAAVNAILSDKSLWGADLTQLKGFEKSVLSFVGLLKKNSLKEILQQELVTQ
jgi:tagaturonate reductase